MERDECPNCKKMWDIATRAERERIAMLMEDCASVIPREVVLKMFNPTPRIDGNEERES